PLVLAHHRDRERLRVLDRQLRERGRLQVAVHTEERHVADLQMEVARTALDGVPEEFVDGHPRSSFGTDPADPERGRRGYYPGVMAGQDGAPAPEEPERPKGRRRRRHRGPRPKDAASGSGAREQASGASRGTEQKGDTPPAKRKRPRRRRTPAVGTTPASAKKKQATPKKRAATKEPKQARLPTQREVSAGGVVYRRGDDGIEVVLASRRTRRCDLAWGLADA